MYAFILAISRNHGSHPKRDKIQAMQYRLHNELIDSEASGSLEVLNVQLDEGVERRHTRAASRQIVLAQT